MNKPILFAFICLSFSACDGGGSGTASGGGDWYYHWNCHGDPDCLSTNPTGHATGDLDEGPDLQMCTPLMTFARHFWGAASDNACDQSPIWSGNLPPPTPTITSVVVTPTNPSVNSGQTKQFTATAHYSNGSSVVVTSTSTWSSSATGIATIGTMGLATAVTSGPTTIQATYSGVAGSTTLNVNPNFSITNYDPQSAAPGTNLTLTGINFPVTSAGTTVKVCGIVATIVSESATQIVVTIPPGIAATQECVVSVTTSGGTAVGSGTLVVFVGAHAPSVYWTERGVGGNQGLGFVKVTAKTVGSPVYALATGLWGPWLLTGNTTHLFWAEYQNGVTNAVKAMSIAGGSWSYVQTAIPPVGNLGLDANNVYWTISAGSTPGSVHKASLVTYIDDLVVGGTSGGPTAVAGDGGTNIYFTTDSPFNLNRIPFGGNPATVLAADPGTPGFNCLLSALTVDATNAYWISLCPNVLSASAIRKVGLAGGPSTAIATGFNSSATTPTSLTVDATSVYWTDYAGVYKVPIAGGPVTTLASVNAVMSFAMDATDVYFTDGNSIKKVSKNGGTVTTLATGLVNVYGVYVDP